MGSSFRMVGAGISLVLVVLATSQPSAAPKFSEWAVPANLGPTTPLSTTSALRYRKRPESLFQVQSPRRSLVAPTFGFRGAHQKRCVGTPVNLGAALNTAANEGPPFAIPRRTLAVLQQQPSRRFWGSEMSGPRGVSIPTMNLPGNSRSILAAVSIRLSSTPAPAF